MKCQLHNEESELQESHIIPKFVYRWLKKTGTGRLRQKRVLNTPLQDGIKDKMLCRDCEQKFSKSETWFNNNVFTKYQNDYSFEVENSRILYEFCISISWRIIKYFKDDGNQYKHKKLLDEAELEWRNFLLSKKTCFSYNNHHLILINEDFYTSFKTETYFSRGVDIEIAESDSKCFIYAKFGNFIIISEILGISNNSLINSNLNQELVFSSKEQSIIDKDILDFFQTRIDEIPSFSDLSKNQQTKNNEYFEKNKERIMKSKYYQILKKYSK